MMAVLPEPRTSLGIANVFEGATKSERGVKFVAYGIAALAHLGFAFAATSVPKPVAEAPKVTEVDIAPPPEPPPPPPPPPEVAPEPEPEAPAVAAPRPAAAAPQVARAGNVVTAKDDGKTESDSEAVTFVTDPEGHSFGSGVVARGGTLDRATTPVRVAPPPNAGPTIQRGPVGDAITPAANLSRAARLDESDPCAGKYPPSAKVDDGYATIALVVRPDGRVSSISVVSESPSGEGFGAAARECLKGKTLAPALDKGGSAVTAAATIRVRFSR